MIGDPELGRIVEAGSRDHLAIAVLLTGDGTPVSYLRHQSGTLRGSARVGDRWLGTLTLAGVDNVPDGPTHPLAGFTGHRVRIIMGATVDTVPHSTTIADLLVSETAVERDARDTRVTVELTGLASFVDAAAPRDWAPLAGGESCSAMITRLVNASRPPGWPAVTVLDTSTTGTSTPVPNDYTARGRSGWQVVTDLSTIANVTAYVDRFSRLVIRDPLPETGRPVARTFHAETDVTRYRLGFGRRGFANRVELRCSPVQVSSDLDQLRDDVVGVAEQTSGPLGTGTIGRVIRDAQQLTGTISQADANRRAAALLPAYLRGWLTSELSVVPDPRLEPDDDVTVTYVDGGSSTHRITELSVDVGTGPTQLACRTLTDDLDGLAVAAPVVHVHGPHPIPTHPTGGSTHAHH